MIGILGLLRLGVCLLLGGVDNFPCIVYNTIVLSYSVLLTWESIYDGNMYCTPRIRTLLFRPPPPKKKSSSVYTA